MTAGAHGPSDGPLAHGVTQAFAVTKPDSQPVAAYDIRCMTWAGPGSAPDRSSLGTVRRPQQVTQLVRHRVVIQVQVRTRAPRRAWSRSMTVSRVSGGGSGQGSHDIESSPVTVSVRRFVAPCRARQAARSTR